MSREAIAKAPVQRPKRTSIGVRGPLSVDKRDPNFTYRFVNDTNGRLEAFKRNGWEAVPASEARIGDSRVEQASPTGSMANVPVGNGTTAVLMRFPKEWYEEDQREKELQIKALEQTMKEDAQREYGKDIKGAKFELNSRD